MIKEKKSIGILTFHRAHNYGAYLQACALCNRLNQEKEFDCEIIDYRMCREKDFYDRKNRNILKRLIRFRKTAFLRALDQTFELSIHDPIMKLSHESLLSDSLEDFIEYCKGVYDVIIVGSDEVWKTKSFRGFPNPYWLSSDLRAMKASYAASCRNDLEELTGSQIEFLKQAWSDFKIISVRDKYTKDLVNSVLGEERAFLSCDPSFIYDFDVPERDVCDILRIKKSNKKNMLVMVSDKRIAYKIFIAFHKDFNLINVFDYSLGYNNYPQISPLEWLQLIKNCDCVITTYFHGTCFSLIHNTPFVSFGAKNKSRKLEGLFDNVSEDISRHFIQNTEDYFADPQFKMKIMDRFEKIEKIDDYLNGQRKSFYNFLHILKTTLVSS